MLHSSEGKGAIGHLSYVASSGIARPKHEPDTLHRQLLVGVIAAGQSEGESNNLVNV